MKNKSEQINQLTEQAINSIENIGRARPRPYLLTRINARINKQKENLWERAGWYIGKPAIAITGLALLIFMNIMAVVATRQNNFTAVIDQASSQVDEYAYTLPVIDDIENTEP